MSYRPGGSARATLRRMPSEVVAMGIDYGTSNTVAMLRWLDGRVQPLLFEGSPLLPSAVYVDGDGRRIVGRDALHHGRFEPARLEPNPKRLVDDESALLGGRAVPVPELIAAVLEHVRIEAERAGGGPGTSVALTHPAGWGPVRRQVMTDAARIAGFDRVTLVPEPTAAAHYFTGVLRRPMLDGHALVVYDLGGGTFDASVVARHGGAIDTLAVDGLDDVGGLDIDAAVIAWIGERFGASHPDRWARLTAPVDLADHQQRRALWHDARVAKEMLSRAPAVPLHLPAIGVDAQLTREEFEAVVRPLLTRTVRATTALIRAADVTAAQLSGVLLVGGSSRVPLVATLLHRAAGVAPTVTEQPELVVAEGALYTTPDTTGVPAALLTSGVPPAGSHAAGFHAAGSHAAGSRASDETQRIVAPVTQVAVPALTGSTPTGPTLTRSTLTVRPGVAPDVAPPVSGQSRRRRRNVTATGVVAVAAVLLGSGLAWAYDRPPDRSETTGPPASALAAGVTPPAGPSPTPSPPRGTPTDDVVTRHTFSNPASPPTSSSSSSAPPSCGQIVVPNVVGSTVDTATNALKAAKLTRTPAVREETALVSFMVGTVIRQSPKAGACVAANQSISLVKGVKGVQAPTNQTVKPGP